MVWLSWLVILPVTTCFMWRIAFSPTNLVGVKNLAAVVAVFLGWNHALQ